MILSLLASVLLATQIRPSIHHALIVGISDYSHAASGNLYWPDLTGDQDAAMVRDTLVAIKRFKPEEIEVLSGAATKAEVIKAFQTWLTAPGRPVGKDDVFYFHFSGHGYRFGLQEVQSKKGSVTNLPLTGARTGFVFSDSKGGDPTRLLTNIEFESLLRPLEAANLTISLDACHSGSGTRRGVMRVRGQTEPGLEDETQSLVAGPADIVPQQEHGFSPGFHPAYTVFSACRFDQEALDTGHGGLFTVSYLKAMRDLASETAGKRIPSYQELYERTYNLMLGNPYCTSAQTPVIEGEKEKELFGSAPLASPNYFPTTYGKDALRLSAGLLFGIRGGEHLDVYEPGGTPANGAKKLATVTVSSVQYNGSVLTPSAAALGGKWAFPAGDAVDTGAIALALGANLSAVRPKLLDGLREAHIAFREVAPEEADVIFEQVSGAQGLAIKNKAGAEIRKIQESEFTDEVRDLDRWRGVTLLESAPSTACPKFQVQLVPVQTQAGATGEHIIAIKPVTAKFTGGERFAVRVRSLAKGGFAPYLSILQITPDHSVTQFWPGNDQPQTAGIVPADGQWHWLNQFVGFTPITAKLGDSESEAIGVWQFVTDRSQLKEGDNSTLDGVGPQLFKAFATKAYIDYVPLLTRQQTRGAFTQLGSLLQAYSNGSRGPVNVPEVFSIGESVVETVAGTQALSVVQTNR